MGDKTQQQQQHSSKDLIQEEGSLGKYQNPKLKKVGFFQLFRFSKPKDYALMGFGTFFALANGATMPLFALFWGDMLNAFNTNDIVSETLKIFLLFIYIGIGAFVSGWIMVACWTITAERQAI